jgi:hypothetical protein
MTNLEIINRLKTSTFADEDGEEYTLDFQPALTDEELTKLDALFPSGRVPDELREILKETRGWEGFGLEITYFDSIGEFGFEELIPHSVTLGQDGLGNFWVLEITADGRCGKIFYACHDPAVLVIFCDTLTEFLSIAEEFYNHPGENYLNEVHDDVVHDVWKSDPNTYDIAEFRQKNPSLQGLLSEFDDNRVVADLRNAKKKDGFAWGRYGSNELTKRLGNELLWVLQKKKKGILSKLFG